MQDSDTSLNIPSLLTVAFISYCVWRFFLNPRPSSSSSSSSSSTPTTSTSTFVNISPGSLRAVNAVADQVMSIYPQVERRAVMWDLHRNGNSIQATVERIMDSARGLDTPPSWYQPAIPSTPTSSQAPSTTRPASSSQSDSTSHNHSIIARYNLQERVREEKEKKVETDKSNELSATQSHDSSSPGSVWSSNPEERRQMLAKRRDDMILAARRKLSALQAGENRDDGGLLHTSSAVSTHGEHHKQ